MKYNLSNLPSSTSLHGSVFCLEHVNRVHVCEIIGLSLMPPFSNHVWVKLFWFSAPPSLSKICSAKAPVPLFRFLYLYSNSRRSPLARPVWLPCAPILAQACSGLSQGSKSVFLHASICLSVYISVEDSDFQVKEVTCLALFCFGNYKL